MSESNILSPTKFEISRALKEFVEFPGSEEGINSFVKALRWMVSANDYHDLVLSAWNIHHGSISISYAIDKILDALAHLTTTVPENNSRDREPVTDSAGNDNDLIKTLLDNDQVRKAFENLGSDEDWYLRASRDLSNSYAPFIHAFSFDRELEDCFGEHNPGKTIADYMRAIFPSVRSPFDGEWKEIDELTFSALLSICSPLLPTDEDKRLLHYAVTGEWTEAAGHEATLLAGSQFWFEFCLAPPALQRLVISRYRMQDACASPNLPPLSVQSADFLVWVFSLKNGNDKAVSAEQIISAARKSSQDSSTEEALVAASEILELVQQLMLERGHFNILCATGLFGGIFGHLFQIENSFDVSPLVQTIAAARNQGDGSVAVSLEDFALLVSVEADYHEFHSDLSVALATLWEEGYLDSNQFFSPEKTVEERLTPIRKIEQLARDEGFDDLGDAVFAYGLFLQTQFDLDELIDYLDDEGSLRTIASDSHTIRLALGHCAESMFDEGRCLAAYRICNRYGFRRPKGSKGLRATVPLSVHSGRIYNSLQKQYGDRLKRLDGRSQRIHIDAIAKINASRLHSPLGEIREWGNLGGELAKVFEHELESRLLDAYRHEEYRDWKISKDGERNYSKTKSPTLGQLIWLVKDASKVPTAVEEIIRSRVYVDKLALVKSLDNFARDCRNAGFHTDEFPLSKVDHYLERLHGDEDLFGKFLDFLR